MKNKEFNTSYNGQEYRDHLLLFIDIIGYSELMLSKNDLKKNAILELQKQLLISDKEGHSKMVIHDNENSKIYTKPLTSLLSDTVVYSFPIQELKDCNDPNSFLGAYLVCIRKIYSVHNLLLKHGMLIRGALVIGKAINYQGMAYGEALAKANELQRNRKPFVYFSKDVISFLNPYVTSHDLKELIINDGGECYFDYLDFIFYGNLGDKRSELFEVLESHIDQINKNLQITAQNEHNHSKWRNIANYYENKIAVLNEKISSFPETGHNIYKGKMIDKKL